MSGIRDIRGAIMDSKPWKGKQPECGGPAPPKELTLLEVGYDLLGQTLDLLRYIEHRIQKQVLGP